MSAVFRGRLPRLLLVFLLAAVATLQASVVTRALTTNETLMYGEPFVLNAAEHPGTRFTDLDRPPYLVTNYPPVYLTVTGAVSRLTRGRPFLPGRLVSVTAWLVATLLVGLLARGAVTGGRGGMALGLAAALFALSPFTQWGFLARVDMLGVALSLAAVWCVDRGPRGAWTAAAALLCVAAIGTKQTFVAAPAAIALFLALRRDWGSLVRFLAWAAVAGAGLVGWTLARTDAAAVWRHLVLYNANRYSVVLLVSWVVSFVREHPLVVVLGALALWRGGAAGRHGLLRLYAGLTALLVLTAGKTGSNFNYFLEPLAALAALGGAFLADALAAREGGQGGPRWRPVVGMALAVQLVIYIRPQIRPFPGWEAVRQDLRGVPGRLLSDDAGFNLVLGKPIEYQPFIYRQLLLQGVAREDPLPGPLSRGAFARVVLRRDPEWESYVWTKAQRDMFGACYRVIAVHGAFEILGPATDSATCREARARLEARGAA